ncbi:dolichyl-phosphate mannosyltransferase polypeptide 2, regulatory subunit S homeolog [Xenopus laevis]|uniref:Dolichol phosphate-mannose biosynthesis regulatory protein n=1 Tax=Xenopus laevis TaxID=8355 RepID=Q641S3_XENLA|nr:dolichyl-phosphate mannosyltransferase polypeptide 2, regulatory subunit S homeolog [Xenopus laevis]AAH82204.1 LOC494631 protein [Xenopus laevis]
MATGSDRLAGAGLVALSSIIFVYYTVWVILLPFIDGDHVIHIFFLPREYAVLLPLVAALVLLLLIGIFVTFITWKSRSPKKKSQ